VRDTATCILIVTGHKLIILTPSSIPSFEMFFFASAMVLFMASASSSAKAEAPGLRGRWPSWPRPPVIVNPLNDLCLSSITGVADTLLSPIELAVRALDPIQIADEQTWELMDLDLSVGSLGCNANANLTADLGTVSGLDSADVSVELVDGDCDISLLSRSGTFKGTWRVSKTLTSLSASVGARVESEACGHPLDASAHGNATIPHASISVDILIEGGVSLRSAPEFTATLSVANLTNVDFDLESVDLGFIAESPLADYHVNYSIENFINAEFQDRVSQTIISFVNGAIGDSLPISYPPSATITM